MALHKDLTGADLHEPKGIASATSGQHYIADGAGSGAWQNLVIPSGLFNITIAEFTSSGTWTKPTGCFMAKAIVIGGGGGSGTSAIAGGTSSFGTYASATGGAGCVASTATAQAGGTGSSGDLNLSGDASVATVVPMSADAGFRLGQFGRGAVGDNSATAGGGGGGASVKYIYAVPATATVTVGAGGTGSRAGQPGVVVVEQYIPV